MIDIYSVKDVARIFGLPESRLRYWAQTGFINPSARKGGRVFYTFRDLINVRAAKELLDAGLSVQAVRKNLASLRTLLPDLEDPASTMRVSSDGETVVARADEVVFEPLSGQLVMDFTIDSLSTRVADILAMPTTEQGVETPAVSLDAASSDAASSDIKAESRDDETACGGADGARAVPTAIGEDDPTESHVAGGPYRYFVMGCEAEDSGDLAAAEVAYRRALELQPSLAAAHTNLGNVIYRQGDARGARAAYERALEYEPNQPEARYNLGNVLEDMGEIELAIAEMRRVCWTHPDFADAHYNLGLMLSRVNGIAQARKHLERYIELDQDSQWSEHARSFLASLGHAEATTA
ncbi:MAG: tetratricopeptide repeat protein [Proteobacteria bacterium]|nr:tetratricopeptide repeat protein [Pseudomonadota bacterium]